VLAHQAQAEASGHRLARRREQAIAWLRELVALGLGRALARDPEVAGVLAGYENRVGEFKISAVSAANELVQRFLRRG
jgi:putative protein kinase ArgK-like GTPase of G3E family